MTVQDRVEKLPPLERFGVLAGELDRLNMRLQIMTAEHPIDDSLALIELEYLQKQFGVPVKSIRSKLSAAGGQVFKIGRKYVIRKMSYLRALEELERRAC